MYPEPTRYALGALVGRRDLADAGVPMRTLQEWLGHREFATMLIYAQRGHRAQRGKHRLISGRAG
jgi:hypothetical protein